MRKVTLFGLDDNLSTELSRDVGVIVEIMQMKESVAVNELTFKVVFTGEQVVDFINQNNLDKELIDKINLENKYEITAYDW